MISLPHLRHCWPLAVCLGIAAGFPHRAQAEPAARAAEIRALVADKFDLEKGPGAAVLVSHDGAPVFLGGFGLADIKSGRKITADTLFDLASVSKHITAVAILTLKEKGRLSLDEPLAKLLPDFKVPVKGRPVTVNDLLHHVSGLCDYTSSDWTGTDDEFAALTPETHLQWLNKTRPHRAPGVKYVYNNTEYVLLSLIVERLSGGSFQDYAQKTLFGPAGMDHTVILDGSAELPASRVKGYAGDGKGKAKPSFSPTVITGDGNVYTSVRDLAAWDAALRNHTLISAGSQKAAWTNGHLDDDTPIDGESGDGYGMGWMIDADRPVVYHSGSWDGTSTYLLVDLRGGYTVAVLSNDENAECSELAESIFALFHKGGDGDEEESATPAPRHHPKPTSRKHPFTDD